MNHSVRHDLKAGQMFRPDIEQAIAVCALRMDGYRYMKRVHPELCQDFGPNFISLVAPVVETLTLHPEPNDNLAAFFWLQRSFHWVGWNLTKYSPDHLAYDHLFLALYRQEVAEEFACIDGNREWQQECATGRNDRLLRPEQLSSDRPWSGDFWQP